MATKNALNQNMMPVIIKVSINVLKEHSINKISIVFLGQHKVVCTGAQKVFVRGGGPGGGYATRDDCQFSLP